MKKHTLWHALPPAILLLGLMLWANGARLAAAQAVRQAATVVFPSLFPFCVVARQLTHSGILSFRHGNRLSMRLLGVPVAGLGAFVMGLCGGYPLGVYTACTLYEHGQLSKAQAERLIPLCNHTGPAFFFGMVGAVLFQNTAACAALYLIHIISAVLTAYLLSKPVADARLTATPLPQAPESLPESIRHSFFAMAQLCACVVFFSVLLQLGLQLPPVRYLIAHMPPSQEVGIAILSAAVDLPSGISAMARIGQSGLRFLLCAAGIGWGGACVHMQAASAWQAAGLEIHGYYRAKLLQTAISCTLAFPAAHWTLGAKIPLWPALLPIVLLIGKTTVDFSCNSRYNKKKTTKNGDYIMLFRKKIDRACAYCARAVALDADTMACTKKGPVPADSACRRFRYDPLKRVPEAASPMLPQDEAADYSL